MHTSITLNLKKIEKQVADLENLSKQKGWEYYYDGELDTLYYSIKKIDSSYSLFSLRNEFSLYVDKDSNLGGVFIEYYKSNLASHDQKFKPFARLFTFKTDHGKTVSKSGTEKAILFSEVLKAEILTQLITQNNKNFQIPT